MGSLNPQTVDAVLADPSVQFAHHSKSSTKVPPRGPGWGQTVRKDGIDPSHQPPRDELPGDPQAPTTASHRRETTASQSTRGSLLFDQLARQLKSLEEQQQQLRRLLENASDAR
jgi:hypothetical protein